MTIGQTVLKYGIKAAGAAGLGVCLYDAHKHGKFRSTIEARKGDTNALMYWFDNSRKLNTPSTVNAKLKDGIFNLELHNNFRRFINSGIGYVKGFASMAAYDLLPIGLSIAAIAAKGKKSSKIAGAALGAYAIFGFAKNVLGLGVRNDNGRI